MYYELRFQTVAAGGGSVNLPTIGGTTTLTDNYTKDVVATSSDEGINDDSLYIREHTRDFVSGRFYTNTCTIYGIDPYNQPFADVATKVDYYSPLLHKSGGSSTFGVFSHFGTYSIK